MNLNDKHNISPNNKKMAVVIAIFSLLFALIIGYMFVLNSRINTLEKENKRLNQLEEAINNTEFALKEDLPTKVSPLENDSNFINKNDANKLIEKEIQNLETKIINKNYASNYELNNKYTELFNKIDGLEINHSKTVINNTIGDTYEAIKERIRDDYFPVGSLYYSMDKNFDPNVAWGGTWVKISEGNFVEATEDETKVGEHEDAGIPNATFIFESWRAGGTAYDHIVSNETTSGFSAGSMWGGDAKGQQVFSLHKANSVYRDDATTVQPNAYYAYIWKRAN